MARKHTRSNNVQKAVGQVTSDPSGHFFGNKIVHSASVLQRIEQSREGKTLAVRIIALRR